LLQDADEEGRHGHPPRRVLAPRPFLLADEDGPALEVDVGDLDAKQLAPAGPGMGSKTHRLMSGMWW
jgi:hypothetical protein